MTTFKAFAADLSATVAATCITAGQALPAIAYALDGLTAGQAARFAGCAALTALLCGLLAAFLSTDKKGI